MNQAAQVVRLPSTKPQAPSVKHRIGKRATRAIRRQSILAGAIGVVAMALTALSLNHLAHGVELVTSSSPWEAWAMAIGIDCGFIAVELSQITIGEKLRRKLAWYAKPAILGTLGTSAVMNAFAFASPTTGWMTYAAIALGIAIPGLIYTLTRIGAAMYIDCHARSH
jgi:hypothetical protein